MEKMVDNTAMVDERVALLGDAGREFMPEIALIRDELSFMPAERVSVSVDAGARGVKVAYRYDGDFLLSVIRTRGLPEGFVDFAIYHRRELVGGYHYCHVSLLGEYMRKMLKKH